MALNEYLSTVGSDMKELRTPLAEYIITKQLTRALSEYSDPKSLPHLQVALRMKS
jgi:DNA polymerase alpha subunit A